MLLILGALIPSCSAFAQSNKYPFEVKRTGSGDRSIIFIPGFASSGDVWKETRAQYEKTFTCYTLTMAGFAGIPSAPGQTFREWEKAIAQYIRDNKIDKPVIIGHSMGGGLALALASDYADLLSKIIVVDALPCLAAMSDPGFQSKSNLDCSASIKAITGMNEEQFLKMQQTTMPRLVSDTSRISEIVQWSVRSDRTTFAQMYCDFSNTDLRADIARIKCPSLILLESYFANFKPAISEQYKNDKSATLAYASKGLHFIMYDDKDWYNDQLADFLK